MVMGHYGNAGVSSRSSFILNCATHYLESVAFW